MTNVSTALKKQVATVPKAIAALVAMERQLTEAKTYDQIRKVVREASAIKVLMGHVDEVKAQAEDTILVAHRRIAEELRKIPKATGRKPKNVSAEEHSKKIGREDTGVPRSTRSRLGKLADMPVETLKAKAQELRDAGKDATPTAVVREITQGNKKEVRDTRERQLSAKIMALPGKAYGVIYADPPWKFEPYSRDTGMDRAADNHYPTMTLDKIKELEVPIAPDAVLFLWATVPMLPEALSVMEAWGFKYVSNFVWVKDRIGTGYWTRNQHELLLIGTKGSVPAPAPGKQYPSAFTGPVEAHSVKPLAFRVAIEAMFPTLPRIELFAREKAEGWDVWGYEAPQQAAE
jgi:N6-adenosine-specific RNA methylase IME4